jgi:putative hydrolase of the HAD superfamily
MTIKGIIFDFDGLIVDTETPELKAWQELFRRFDVEFSFDEYAQTIGMIYDDTSALDILESKLNTPIDKGLLFKEFKKRKVELIDAQPLRSGVLDVLKSAKSIGLKIGLASSAKLEWVSRYIQMHEIDHYFDCIKTRETVANPKPDPELYQATLACLGLEARQVIALEDSINGVSAARAAGVHTVAVPNSVTCIFDFSQAHLVLEHLTDIPLQEMITFFEKQS